MVIACFGQILFRRKSGLLGSITYHLITRLEHTRIKTRSTWEVCQYCNINSPFLPSSSLPVRPSLSSISFKCHHLDIVSSKEKPPTMDSSPNGSATLQNASDAVYNSEVKFAFSLNVVFMHLLTLDCNSKIRARVTNLRTANSHGIQMPRRLRIQFKATQLPRM